MKIIFLGAILSMMAATAWAQGDQPDPFCYQAKDYTCDGVTGCASVPFKTIEATRVIFRCEAACSNNVNPLHCHYTAFLSVAGSSQTLASCDNWNGEQCAGDRFTQVALEANTEYTITVRLQACGTGSDCCGNCRAVATCYEAGAVCPAP